MLIFRLLFILSALAIILSGIMYLLGKDRRYLNLAWQIARFDLYAVIIFALLFLLERYVLVGWLAIF
jgi:hypothetical protein